MDLKTLGSSKRHYSVAPQLGGYLAMLIDRCKLVVDECCVMWSAKNDAHMAHFDDDGKQLSARDEPTPDACLEAWEDSYSYWSSLQEEL